MGVLGGVRNWASKAKNWVTDLVDLRSGGSKKLDLQPSYDPSRGTSPASATSVFGRNPFQDILDQNARDTSPQPRTKTRTTNRQVQQPQTPKQPVANLANQRMQQQQQMPERPSYDPVAYYKDLRGEYNVGEMEETLQGLTEQVLTTEELLENVEGDITEGTKGFLVPEHSRRKMVAERRKPLTEELSQLSRARERERAGLNKVYNLINTLAELRGQQYEQRLEPYQEARELAQEKEMAKFKAGLGNRYARGTAGEREESAAKASLKSDIQNWRPGTTFEGLVKKYGDVLPLWEIASTYDAYSPYGPHEESIEEIRGWLPESKQQGNKFIFKGPGSEGV